MLRGEGVRLGKGMVGVHQDWEVRGCHWDGEGREGVGRGATRWKGGHRTEEGTLGCRLREREERMRMRMSD
jgi:hypothetical protein